MLEAKRARIQEADRTDRLVLDRPSVVPAPGREFLEWRPVFDAGDST